MRTIERSLEDSADDDAIRVLARELRRHFGITPEATDEVPDYPSFLAGLRGLPQQARIQREREL